MPLAWVSDTLKAMTDWPRRVAPGFFFIGLLLESLPNHFYLLVWEFMGRVTHRGLAYIHTYVHLHTSLPSLTPWEVYNLETPPS